MPRKTSRKKSVDVEILQKLKEIDREFKSMERFRLTMVKSRKARIMKRIKKGEPADYEGYKKELTARVKTHLTRINKSIKSYSKILKKKSRKPLKKASRKSNKFRVKGTPFVLRATAKSGKESLTKGEIMARKRRLKAKKMREETRLKAKKMRDENTMNMLVNKLERARIKDDTSVHSITARIKRIKL